MSVESLGTQQGLWCCLSCLMSICLKFALQNEIKSKTLKLARLRAPALRILFDYVAFTFKKYRFNSPQELANHYFFKMNKKIFSDQL